MKKETLKQIRNKMIDDLWNEKKAIWEMKDVAYLFNLSLPQIYRILKYKYIKKVVEEDNNIT